MRQALNQIRKIKADYLLDQLEYELKVSSSQAETEALRKCTNFDQVLIILELNDGY
jgi:hypothetical protein